MASTTFRIGLLMHRSRKIFKFFDDHLILIFQRVFMRFDDVKEQLGFFLAWSRYTRGEDMLIDSRRPGTDRRPANGLKARPARFPMHDVGQGAFGYSERRQVARNIKRLDAKLRIVLIRGVAPTAHLNIQFAEMLISAPVIKRIKTQDGGRL